MYALKYFPFDNETGYQLYYDITIIKDFYKWKKLECSGVAIQAIKKRLLDF